MARLSTLRKKPVLKKSNNEEKIFKSEGVKHFLEKSFTKNAEGKSEDYIEFTSDAMRIKEADKEK